MEQSFGITFTFNVATMFHFPILFINLVSTKLLGAAVYLFQFLFHAARDSEILRLKQLLDEKTEKNNSTATRSVDQTPELVHENPTRMSPRRKTPQSNMKAKRVQLSESTVIPHSGLEEESQEVSYLWKPTNSL
jgi:hypothetical protein